MASNITNGFEDFLERYNEAESEAERREIIEEFEAEYGELPSELPDLAEEEVELEERGSWDDWDDFMDMDGMDEPEDDSGDTNGEEAR